MRAIILAIVCLFAGSAYAQEKITSPTPVFYYFGPVRELRFTNDGEPVAYGTEKVVEHEPMLQVLSAKEGEFVLCSASVVMQPDGRSYMFFFDTIVKGKSQGWFVIAKRKYGERFATIMFKKYATDPEEVALVRRAVAQWRVSQIVGVRLPLNFGDEQLAGQVLEKQMQRVRLYLEKHTRVQSVRKVQAVEMK